MLSHNGIPSRFPADRSIEDDMGRWWVLQTKPNRDLKLAKYLLKQEISYYMPLHDQKIRYGALRKEKVLRGPLIKGYLCVALDKTSHNRLYNSHDFARIIEVKDQSNFVKELQSLSRVTEAEQDLDVRPGVLKGRPAFVVSGPLKGVEGIVLNRVRKGHFAISVEMFSRTVVLNVNPRTNLGIR